MTDEEALLRGVLLHPECDTARLVYADRLDDLGQHDRAEFIRVQCEIGRLPSIFHKASPNEDCPCFGCVLLRRERELLTDARRAEWFGIKCPACEGSGKMSAFVEPSSFDPARCPHCTGTGFAPVEFRRGFVESVRCRLGDVLRPVCGLCAGSGRDTNDRRRRCPRCSGTLTVGAQYEPAWVLTDWARGVLDAHPVTRWEIVDREPAGLGTGVAEWYSERADLPNETYRLPTVVFAQLKNAKQTFASAYAQGGVPVSWFAVYDSEAEARDALASAVGRVARRKWEEEAKA